MEQPRGTLLLTGFEPFQGRPVNGSATLARALHDRIIRDYRVEARVFPVVWKTLPPLLDAAINEVRPDLILGLGEGKKEYPCFENFARNDAIGTDEAGIPPPAPVLIAGAPPVLKTSMQCEKSWFSGLPLPVARSENAGFFLCNALFYRALSQHRGPAGFLHLPIQGPCSDDDYLSRIIPILYRLISQNVRIHESR